MRTIMRSDFAALILTHGRPDNVVTYDTLRRQGYTGKIYIIIDNEDKKADGYYQRYGPEVVMFDKKAESLTFDQFDNFDDRRAIVYARNASFRIAEELGIRYFIQLDDDYDHFSYRINGKGEHPTGAYIVKNELDRIFELLVNYYEACPQFTTIAVSQGGDWFGGERMFGKAPKRKAMNTFICDVQRPFKFIGRINEDVNTYTSIQQRGGAFLTIPFIQVNQQQTQSNKGGMTDIYLDGGTYIKSFYTIICSPGNVHIGMMGRSHRRLHHIVNWRRTAPKIIQEKWKRTSTT